jgi:hypothetical protein
MASADSRLLETVDLKRRDIVSGPLRIEPQWQHGVIRVEIELTAGASRSSSWEFVVTGDHSEQLMLNGQNADSRISSTTNPARLNVDIPVPAWNTLQVTRTTLVKSVIAVEAHYASQARAQQIIKGSQVDRFDDEVGPLERQLALAFGRLDVADVTGNTASRVCTAFRVKTGYWLTAAHCLTRDDTTGSPDVQGAWIQPAAYAGRGEPPNRLKTTVLLTGQSSGAWSPNVVLKDDELDFALLRVPDDPGGPAFTLSEPPPPPQPPLQLLMHWSQNPIGKARSAGSPCVLKSLVGTTVTGDQDQCYRAMQHGCTSDDGASGAALVLRGSPQSLIGLNYRGGLLRQFNCAIPAATIRSFLCETNRPLANEVTQCPLK